MAKTLQEQYASALLSRGETEIHGRSSRYRVFTRSRHDDTFYFLGKAGALRAGRSVSHSTPTSETFKELLLADKHRVIASVAVSRPPLVASNADQTKQRRNKAIGRIGSI